jgi:capsular polysaccharide biosynthesis protein
VSQPQSAPRRQVEFLKRQLWFIVLVAAVALAATAVATLSQKKVYRASTKIFVGSSGTLNPQFGNIQPFTQTMSSLLMSDIVAKRVVTNLGLNATPEAILRNLNVASTPESAVLQVNYDSHNRRQAVRILKEVGLVFTSLVRKKLGHPTTPDVPVVTATVFDPAHASPDPVSPHPLRTLAFAGVIGLALGIALALLRDTLDERIRTREEMEELFGSPVMAVLPRNMVGRPAIDPVKGLDPARAHAVDPLRLQLARAGSTEGLITVTSGDPHDGQSAVAASIALALALDGDHVICVDASPQWKRSLSYYLNVPASEAVERPVVGTRDLGRELREIELDSAGQRSGIETVPGYAEDRSRDSVHELPTTGSRGNGRLQLLQLADGALSNFAGFPSSSIADLAAELKSQAAWVVVDAPGLPSAATFALLSVTDTAIVVGRELRTTKEQAAHVRSALDTLQVESYGLVSIGRAGAPVPPYGRTRSDSDQPFSSKRVRRAR